MDGGEEKQVETTTKTSRRPFVVHRRRPRKKQTVENGEEEEEKEKRTCRWFASLGVCRLGERCRFVHHLSTTPSTIISTTPTSTISTRVDPAIPSSTISTRVDIPISNIPMALFLSSNQKDSEEQKRLRQGELLYLKRRFAKAIINEQNGQGDSPSSLVRLEYHVLDPDWMFDVKSIHLSISLPVDYPIAMANIQVEQRTLPDVLSRHLSSAMLTFLRSKHETFLAVDKFECISRPFFRWLERNILALFVEGLKRTKLVIEAEMAGITLATKPSRTTMPSMSCEMNDFEVETEEDRQTMDQDNFPSASKAIEISHLAEIAKPSTSITSVSVPLRVTWRDLSDNVASLMVTNVNLVMKCQRCGDPSDVSITSIKPSDVSITSINLNKNSRCQRCHSQHSIRLVPQILHQNSDQLAEFGFYGCRPIDFNLLRSEFVMVCLACNREASIRNIGYGIAHKSWCFGCHKRCEFIIESSRFIGDLRDIPIGKMTGAAIKSKKSSNPPQTLTMIEGQPLPDNGTCKHYKKSYRWLRFPCCGKLYPCDLCHGEKESEHEMKMANRMVCGFCSREQAYQRNKGCVHCKGTLTHQRTGFWEGGKGCRDKTAMARAETRKYTGNGQKKKKKNG